MIEDIDRKILKLLQSDSQKPASAIGDAVGLSTSSAHRRIRLLEERGLIRGYNARLDGEKLGYGMMFFVEITLEGQSEAVLAAFEKAALSKPDVLECFLTTGDADYVLRVAAKDTDDYERIHRKIISSLPHVTRIQSSLVMKTVKSWQGYPL